MRRTDNQQNADLKRKMSVHKNVKTTTRYGIKRKAGYDHENIMQAVKRQASGSMGGAADNGQEGGEVMDTGAGGQ